jgi:hypothetical protein
MDRALAEHFAAHGWVLIPDAVDPTAIDAVRGALGGVYPTFGEFQSDPVAHSSLADGQFGGLRLWPLNNALLDAVPFDDRLVSIAETLMRTSDLRLLRAGYQAKYAATVDFNQVLHYDYPNHSLVVPADDEIVGFFLYISDVTDELGPTAVLSDTVRGPVTPQRTHLDPRQWPEFYEAEHRAVGGAGSVLAYRSTTYHRGTAMTAETGVRLTLGWSFGRPAPWTGYLSFPRLGEDAGLIDVIATTSPRRRELLGFPSLGDPYWTDATLQAVVARYPGFDPSPYT